MTALRLADIHGRVATDLRVSLTDRCNLRCSYCMPAEGLDWLPSEETLTDERRARILASIDHIQQLPGVLNAALIYHEELLEGDA